MKQVNQHIHVWFKLFTLIAGPRMDWQGWFFKHSDARMQQCSLDILELLKMKIVFINVLHSVLLILSGTDCGSNNWESFILCPRSESWKGVFIHLSRWHNKAVDVPWLPCIEGISKFSSWSSELVLVFSLEIKIFWTFSLILLQDVYYWTLLMILNVTLRKHVQKC